MPISLAFLHLPQQRQAVPHHSQPLRFKQCLHLHPLFNVVMLFAVFRHSTVTLQRCPSTTMFPKCRGRSKRDPRPILESIRNLHNYLASPLLHNSPCPPAKPPTPSKAFQGSSCCAPRKLPAVLTSYCSTKRRPTGLWSEHMFGRNAAHVENHTTSFVTAAHQSTCSHPHETTKPCLFGAC
jgi:hypothetical protein